MQLSCEIGTTHQIFWSSNNGHKVFNNSIKKEKYVERPYASLQLNIKKYIYKQFTFAPSFMKCHILRICNYIWNLMWNKDKNKDKVTTGLIYIFS